MRRMMPHRPPARPRARSKEPGRGLAEAQRAPHQTAEGGRGPVALHRSDAGCEPGSGAAAHAAPQHLASDVKQLELMAKYMAELGLTPASRSRLAITLHSGPKPWEYGGKIEVTRVFIDPPEYP